MDKLTRFFATTTRPADATAYTAGDEVSNSATPGSVVRLSFDLSGFTRGRIVAAAMDVTPASSNVVITAFNLNAIVFKSADVPAAVGDNVKFPITGAQRRKAIGAFLFDDGAWTNPLGAFTASTSAYQETPASMSLPTGTPAIAVQHVPGYFFEFTQGESKTLYVVLQALAAWTPLAVVNTIGFAINVEAV